MPSYVEGETTIHAVVNNTTVSLKPILFTQYDKLVKYMLHITYEDSTTKDVEIVQQSKDRPYRFTFKKEGQLLEVIGIPKIYEVKDGCKYVDFANRVMDSDDLLFEVDCSGYFECNKVRFYLKDIRDIIDLVNEPDEDPEDPIQVHPFTMYPIYLNEHSCQNVINCEVDDDFKVTLTSRITKIGETLSEDEYSGFTILSVTSPVIVDSSLLEINKVPLVFTEDTLGTEIKVILKYYIKEISHPVFDEFTIIATKKSDDETQSSDITTLDRAVTTQDMQYLGDGLEPSLGNDLTPGYKEYQYTNKD